MTVVFVSRASCQKRGKPKKQQQTMNKKQSKKFEEFTTETKK